MCSHRFDHDSPHITSLVTYPLLCDWLHSRECAWMCPRGHNDDARKSAKPRRIIRRQKRRGWAIDPPEPWCDSPLTKKGYRPRKAAL